jgi:hypothetical protein
MRANPVSGPSKSLNAYRGGVMRLVRQGLALMVSLLFLGASAAWAAETQDKPANPHAEITLHTLDGDVQQVNIDEIWRVREASGRDEPSGSIMVDYAFERVFVKEPLNTIIDGIRAQRKVEKFTSPVGAPVYIVADKVIGISKALPFQHHPNTKAIIIAREGQQQVQESRDAVRDALGK